MTDSLSVTDWHERLLAEALDQHKANPDFRFNLRTTDVTGKDRLQKGYWFTGSERYLFFAPFRPNDPNNKTRTIGFVIGFDAGGKPKRCFLEIVFGSSKDVALRKLYEQMISELGSFKISTKDKYQRAYKSHDPIVAFREFLLKDYPQLLKIIRDSGQDKAFLVSEQEFNVMLNRIELARTAKKAGSANGGGAKEAAIEDLCLLGTWSGIGTKDAERVNAAIASKGGWASWWSFPIREKYKAALKTPFYCYLNAGGGRLPYRMKVEKFETSHGNKGMASPWPDSTDADLAGKVRTGPKNSEICKTWLYVTSIESLTPELSLADFDPADGLKSEALLNQSAFGYAVRRKGGGASAEPDTQSPINLILYGPPGTGKTHWLQQKFDEFTDTPSNVDHDTWLQELLAGYGWRPVIAAAIADLSRPARVPEIRDHHWVQAKAKQRGRTTASVHAMLWSYLQEHTPETVTAVKVAIRRPPFIFSKKEMGEWELQPDWQELDEESAELSRLLKTGPRGAVEAIRRYRVVTFHPSFSYEDFVRGIRPVATAEDGTTQFRVVDGIFKQICDEARANPAKRYALFIDEINRANIAKVFGELITLIEFDKRAVFSAEGRLLQGMAVQLPGGAGADVAEPPFGVPRNLDIFGTMNTADRSIALLDVALRRRFEFQEMEPDYALLSMQIEQVNLGGLLRRINNRLEYLLDRDHRVGHAYLMKAKSIADLRRAFQVQIIPLLQEYFFDDMSRVALVLATDPTAPPFLSRERLTHAELFPGARGEGLAAERERYVVTPESSWTSKSFLGIYELGGGVEKEVELA